MLIHNYNENYSINMENYMLREWMLSRKQRDLATSTHEGGKE